jgi:hypothetical protein
MGTGLTIILWIAGLGLSWFTAYSVGRFWTESKIIGGGLRLMVIMSVVLAAVGFTSVYLMLLLYLAMSIGLVSPNDVQALSVFNFGVAGIPGVGALPGLWLNGQVAGRRAYLLGGTPPPVVNLPVAPADTLDMALNAPSLVDGTGGVLKGLFGGGSGGDSGGSGGDGDGDSFKLFAILVLIGLAVLALCAGAITTFLIVQNADREHVAEIFDLYKPPDELAHTV